MTQCNYFRQKKIYNKIYNTQICTSHISLINLQCSITHVSKINLLQHYIFKDKKYKKEYR